MADGRWQMADGRWQMAGIRRHEPAAYNALLKLRTGRDATEVASAHQQDRTRQQGGVPGGPGTARSVEVARSSDVRVRSFDFACDVVRLHRDLQAGDWTVRRLANQLLASGTSIGA